MGEAERAEAGRLLTAAEEARRDTDHAAQHHERLRAELGSIRTTLSGLVASPASGDAALGLRLASALRNLWLSEPALLDEGAGWLDRFLAHPALPAGTDGWSRAVDDAAALAFWRGDYPQARALEEQSLAAERRLAPSTGLVVRLIHLGILAALCQDDMAAADRFLAEALSVARSLGDRWGTAASLDNLARVRLEQENATEARGMAEEAVALYRELGQRQPTAAALGVVASAAGRLGDFAAAHAHLTESLAIADELRNVPFARVVLERFAELAAAQGDARRALRLAGAAAVLRETVPAEDMPGHAERHARALAPARQGLDPAAADAWTAEGRRMSLQDARTYALGAGA